MLRVTTARKGLGAEGGTRTPTSFLTRPSIVRVCQFRHFGIWESGVRCALASREVATVESNFSNHPTS